MKAKVQANVVITQAFLDELAKLSIDLTANESTQPKTKIQKLLEKLEEKIEYINEVSADYTKKRPTYSNHPKLFFGEIMSLARIIGEILQPNQDTDTNRNTLIRCAMNSITVDLTLLKGIDAAIKNKGAYVAKLKLKHETKLKKEYDQFTEEEFQPHIQELNEIIDEGALKLDTFWGIISGRYDLSSTPIPDIASNVVKGQENNPFLNAAVPVFFNQYPLNDKPETTGFEMHILKNKAKIELLMQGISNQLGNFRKLHDEPNNENELTKTSATFITSVHHFFHELLSCVPSSDHITTDTLSFAMPAVRKLINKGVLNGLDFQAATQPYYIIRHLEVALLSIHLIPQAANSRPEIVSIRKQLLDAYFQRPLSSPEDSDASFINGLSGAFESYSKRLSTQINQLLKHLMPEASYRDVYSQSITDATINPVAHSAFKMSIKYNDYLQNYFDVMQPTLSHRKKVIEKPKRAKTLTAVHENAQRLGQKLQADEITRNSWQYQLARAKYTLTANELELLTKVTGMEEMKTLVPTLKHKNTNTYQQALLSLETEIRKRDDIGGTDRFKRFFTRLFFDTRVDHLIAAHLYIKHHAINREMTKSPEIRLGYRSKEPGKSRLHENVHFRDLFQKYMRFLPWVSAENRALIKLNNILQSKNNYANLLKDTYTKEDFQRSPVKANKQAKNNNNKMKFKSTINNEVYRRLTPKTSFLNGQRQVIPGSFFEPLKVKLFLLGESPFFKTQKDIVNAQEKASKMRELIETINLYKAAKSKLDDFLTDQKTRNGVETDISCPKLVGTLPQKIRTHLSHIDAIMSDDVTLSSDQKFELEQSLYDCGKKLSEECVKTYKIPLEEMTQSTYLFLSDAKRKFEESMYYYENFNPTAKDALNHIGENVDKAKQSYKEIYIYGNAYTSNIKALVSAKQELKKILDKLISEVTKDPNYNTNYALYLAIMAIKNRHNFIFNQSGAFLRYTQINQFCPDYINTLKNNQIITGLETLSHQLKDGTVDFQASVTQLNKEITTFENILAIEKNRVQTLVNNAKENLEAVVHMADHFTETVRLNG